MGGRIYKRCDDCGRWVHRDESVLRSIKRKNGVDRIRSITTRSSVSITNSQQGENPESSDNHSPNLQRRICLFCVEQHDLKHSPEFARHAATGSDTRTSGSSRNR